jgi:hypothetical protein
MGGQLSLRCRDAGGSGHSPMTSSVNPVMKFAVQLKLNLITKRTPINFSIKNLDHRFP